MDLSSLWDCISSSGCVITQASAGLISGALLFLVASGLTLIFGVLGFVNFMHGSFYMLGGYMAYTAYQRTGSFFLATLCGAAGVALVGAVLEKTVVKRIYGINPLYQILVCYAFILIFDDLVRMVWGADFLSMGMPPAFQSAPFFILGGVVPPFYLLLFGVSLAIAVVLMVALTGTKVGSLIRAAAVNRVMVAALGVNTRLIYTLVFALGAFLAGAAGALAAPVRSVSAGMGFGILIDSFIVTVIGGMGSVVGALIVALSLGLLRAFGALGFPLFTDGLVFIVMAVFLVLKPEGLMGSKMRAF